LLPVKVAVLIDLARHGEMWEGIYDQLLAEERANDKRLPYETVRRRLVRSGKAPCVVTTHDWQPGRKGALHPPAGVAQGSIPRFSDSAATAPTPGRGIIESRRNVMTIDVDAVYENGILTLKHPVDLPENAEVHVTIQTAAEARTPLGRRLRELRAEIVKSGMAPLGWDEIDSEVAV